MHLESALWEIAHRHPYGLSKVRLLKLLWHAELRMLHATGSRLSDADWYRWHHGPFSKDAALIIEKSPAFAVREEEIAAGVLHRVHALTRGEYPVGDREEVDLIESVCNFYRNVPTETLKSEIYDDPFFRSTAKGQRFRFEELPRFRPLEPEAEDLARLLLEPRIPYTGPTSLTC